MSRRVISFVIAMVPMVRLSLGASQRWAYGIARFRLDLLGKTDSRRGSSDRFGGTGLDHVVIFGEQHLGNLLNSYQEYYNESRTHLSLKKDAPIPHDARRVRRVLALPILGGVHHRYARVWISDRDGHPSRASRPQSRHLSTEKPADDHVARHNAKRHEAFGRGSRGGDL